MAGHSETAFEIAIEHGLTARGGYARRSPADFNEDLCLFPADVLGFLRDTQAQKWDQLEALLKGQTADQVLSDLTKELATKGTLHVLRHGFRCYGKTLRLAYFQPNTGMNPETTELYAKNRLTITRQVAFPQRGYTGIKSLVAFSGTVEDPAIPESAYTEVGMNNGLPEAELPETFDGDEFRVLLVADKYQTGFDQPLLQAMYVVKRLAGVQAVQTLSRLNRMAPGKARTFVLDFANEEDDIFKAFKPYYEDTPMGESVDPQRLNELQHRVLEWAIFTTEDVSAFSVVWYGKKKDHTATDHRTMNAILDRSVDAFQRREEEEREEFRGQITAFRNLYAFLSQIIPYQDSELEQFYTFCRNLISKLPPPGDGSSFTLDDEVALKYFRIQQMTQGSISLDDGEADPLKGPTDVGSGGRKDEEVGLKDLVERLNERFGTSFTRADQLFFEQVRESAESNERIVEAALANKYDNFASYLERMLDELFIDRMDGNEEVFSKVMSDQPFRAAVHKGLSRELYERIRARRSN